MNSTNREKLSSQEFTTKVGNRLSAILESFINAIAREGEEAISADFGTLFVKKKY